jgi:hypothetical protein
MFTVSPLANQLVRADGAVAVADTAVLVRLHAGDRLAVVEGVTVPPVASRPCAGPDVADGERVGPTVRCTRVAARR